MRADRLLRGMHRVLHHDLPNELVVLRSLLQMLTANDGRHLSAEAQDYVRRLKNAALRVNEQVRFLKTMERINTRSITAESIPFTTLANDVKSELARRRPHVEFAFEWHWEMAALVGDRRSLAFALAELIAALIGPEARHCRAWASSQNCGDHLELAIQLDARHASWTEKAVNERMEMVLAREWLALSAAQLEVILPADGSAQLLISIPNRATDA